MEFFQWNFFFFNEFFHIYPKKLGKKINMEKLEWLVFNSTENYLMGMV